MAHGLNTVLKRSPTTVSCKTESKSGAGSRRIFAPHFKLQVLDSYRRDADCKGNQRATARKYGIHRRQIQKWLQVESNLRNTVCKIKSECSNFENCNDTAKRQDTATLRLGRLQDATPSPPDGVTQRVPAPSRLEVKTTIASSAPLDFSTRSRASPNVAAAPSPPDSPIDLSLKRGPPSPDAPVPYRLPSPSPLSLRCQPQPDVWDLSTKRKSDVTCLSPTEPYEDPPKAIKLFKPYLDDLNKESSSSSCSSSTSGHDECPPPCCTMPLTPPTLHSDFYYYNHNNNLCEIKAECTYTIHELQPKSNVTCCYPYPTQYTISEYEQNPYYCHSYEDNYVSNLTPLKQRQSYSLDFKLSAIDSYYEDSKCKGNQRAVANKYNIHRRQVQKWLKQEDELRQKYQVMKRTELVRIYQTSCAIIPIRIHTLLLL